MAVATRKKPVLSLQPMLDRIIIEREEGDEFTPGGLALPDSVRERERPSRGTVLAVGPGKRNPAGGHDKPAVEVGDVVYFAKYAGDEITQDEVKYTIIREEDVMAILEAY